jgi:hypothetical protein
MMDSASFAFLFWITMGLTLGIILAAGLFMWIASIASKEFDRQMDEAAGPYRPVERAK